jgi:large subunit ribosomal protein L30
MNGTRLTDKFVKEKFGHESVQELAQALARGQISLKMLWHEGVKPVFRLHPPSGGFESSIKRPFRSQGELGYRGEGILHLVARMM